MPRKNGNTATAEQVPATEENAAAPADHAWLHMSTRQLASELAQHPAVRAVMVEGQQIDLTLTGGPQQRALLYFALLTMGMVTDTRIGPASRGQGQPAAQFAGIPNTVTGITVTVPAAVTAEANPAA